MEFWFSEGIWFCSRDLCFGFGSVLFVFKVLLSEERSEICLSVCVCRCVYVYIFKMKWWRCCAGVYGACNWLTQSAEWLGGSWCWWLDIYISQSRHHILNQQTNT